MVVIMKTTKTTLFKEFWRITLSLEKGRCLLGTTKVMEASHDSNLLNLFLSETKLLEC